MERTEIKQVNVNTLDGTCEFSVWMEGVCLGLFENKEVAAKVFSIGRLIKDFRFKSNQDRRDYVKAIMIKR